MANEIMVYADPFDAKTAVTHGGKLPGDAVKIYLPSVSEEYVSYIDAAGDFDNVRTYGDLLYLLSEKGEIAGACHSTPDMRVIEAYIPTWGEGGYVDSLLSTELANSTFWFDNREELRTCHTIAMYANIMRLYAMIKLRKDTYGITSGDMPYLMRLLRFNLDEVSRISGVEVDKIERFTNGGLRLSLSDMMKLRSVTRMVRPVPACFPSYYEHRMIAKGNKPKLWGEQYDRE